MPKEAGFAALITALALFVYMVLTVNVGRARNKFNVQPPTTMGNPDFERVLRVQQNTLEHMVVFLPSLWLFTFFVDPKMGAGLGAVWILARILYAWGYYQEAKKRAPGFLLAVFTQLALLLGSVYGTIMNVVR